MYDGLIISGKTVKIGALDMSALISAAFHISPRLIVGIPIVYGDSFAIEARMPAGATKDQIPEMLSSLLYERFHLKIHLQDMEQPGYALVTGKSPLRLNKPREIDLSGCDPWTDNPSIPGEKICHSRTSGRMTSGYTNSEWGPILTTTARGTTRDEYFRVSMPVLAGALAIHLSNGRGPFSEYVPVVDRTGILGDWDVVLEIEDPFSLPGITVREAAELNNPREAYTTALARVGLRLQKTSVSVKKLVVDHVDNTPTSN